MLTFLLAAVLTSPGTDAPKADRPLTLADISGIYESFTPGEDGGIQSGVVRVMKANNVWAVYQNSGLSASQGIGVIRGNVFSVAWKNGEGVTVSSYSIEDDCRTFRGTWATLPGDGKQRQESWKKLK